MKKIIFTTLSAILTFFSCNDDINYLSEFKVQYSLNCILRNDRTTHFATIKRSYRPEDNIQSNDLENAVITLSFSDTTLHFKDTVLTTNIINNHQLNSYYFLDNYNLTKDTELKIEATLPDGTVLSSSTHSPNYYNLILDTKNGASPQVIPSNDMKNRYIYIWKIFGNYIDYVFGPSLYIKYFLSGDEENIIYKDVSGNYLRQINAYEVSLEFLNKAMSEISEGINNKSSINIVGAGFEVKVYDIPLGIYANSIQTFEDEFSIRISVPDISNIDGGLGIFGTYVSEYFEIEITPDYIESFEYTPVN